MVTMFLDERVTNTGDDVRFSVASIVVNGDRWSTVHAAAARVREVRARRRLDELQRLLGEVPGFGVLGFADIPPALDPPREVDSTRDVPEMRRRDTIWSVVSLASVVSAVAALHSTGAPVGDVELYYERRDLKSAHRAAFEITIRHTLPEVAAEAPEMLSRHALPPSGLRFVRVEQVHKRRAGTRNDAHQNGVSLAHHLCAQAGGLTPGLYERIVVRNLTERVHEMLAPFAAPAQS
jgi:hypothetical protein